ncbi:hypothetical protein PQI51_08670 [Microbacterium esteraromaticum]|uniref:hypothetical protein n=1 Tax=Microbacterium esteraromaticum TaxID=57043 RepID=UPI0030A0EF19
MTTHTSGYVDAPGFSDALRDCVYMTMETATDLYIRESGEALIVIHIDNSLCDDDDIARVRAHAANLSQRDGITVRVDRTYEETIEVFEAGRLAHQLEGAFYEAVRYRHQSWLVGAQDPWRAWELGGEPVTRYVPSQPPECGCVPCEAHTEVRF